MGFISKHLFKNKTVLFYEKFVKINKLKTLYLFF